MRAQIKPCGRRLIGALAVVLYLLDPSLLAARVEPLIATAVWGSDRSTPDRLDAPRAIAVGANSVYVLDGPPRIVETTRDGELIRVIGEGLLEQPSAIAVDREGRLLVADSFEILRFADGVLIERLQPLGLVVRAMAVNRAGELVLAEEDRIVLADPSGRYIRSFGFAGRKQIRALATLPNVDGTDDVVLVDRFNRRVERYSASGELLTTLTTDAATSTQTLLPVGVAADGEGHVHVADFRVGAGALLELDATGGLVRRWGREGVGEGEIFAASGIAVDQAGNIYVLQATAERVQRFTPQGRFERAWGHGSDADGVLSSPTGLAIDSLDGSVLVLDYGHHRVQRFDPSGRWLDTFGSYGTQIGAFRNPMGLAIDPRNGDVWLSDRGNNRIQKLRRDGTPIFAVGERGSAPGQFAIPYGLGVAGDGSVFVADSDNRRIQHFDADGNFLASWGTEPHFVFPYSLAVDRHGGVYVGGSGSSLRVARYSAAGVFRQLYRGLGFVAEGIAVDSRGVIHATSSIYSLLNRLAPRWGGETTGGTGHAPGRLSGPIGVAVDDSGQVFVADTGNDRIQRLTVPCVASEAVLCLGAGRFRVEVDWRNQYDGSVGIARAIRARDGSDVSGYFAFALEDNAELVVKVIDFGGSVKVFYSQLTDLEFALYVTDTRTGKRSVYGPTPGNCGAIDQDALRAAPISPATGSKRRRSSAGTCVASLHTLCLQENRFALSATWRNHYLPQGEPGASGSAIASRFHVFSTPSELTGLFAFDDPANIELVVKVLDFGNDDILILYGALSDFEYALTVTDTTNDTQHTFTNPAGRYCGGFDRDAF